MHTLHTVLVTVRDISCKYYLALSQKLIPHKLGGTSTLHYKIRVTFQGKKVKEIYKKENISAEITAKNVTLWRVGWECHLLKENVPSYLTYIQVFNYSRVTMS
jgi:hypothetical protein